MRELCLEFWETLFSYNDEVFNSRPAFLTLIVSGAFDITSRHSTLTC